MMRGSKMAGLYFQSRPATFEWRWGNREVRSSSDNLEKVYWKCQPYESGQEALL